MPANLDEIFDDATLTGLFDIYTQEETATMRQVLTVAHAAMVLAIDQRAAQVTAPHVASAQADLG